MSKGKFESSRKKPAAKSAQSAGRNPRKKKSPVVPIVAAAAALVLVAVGVVLFVLLKDDGKIHSDVYACGLNLGGMTKEEAKAALLQKVGTAYTDNDLTVTLSDGDPIILKPEDTRVAVDLDAAVDAAYKYGRGGSIFSGKTAEDSQYFVEPDAYISVDSSYLRTVAESAAEGRSSELIQTTVEESSEIKDVEVTLEDGTTEKQLKEVPQLIITLGTAKDAFSAEDLYNTVMDAYGRMEFETELVYAYEQPDPLDVDALAEKYCTEAEDASYDPETFEILPGKNGYGFDKEALLARLEEAKGGDVIVVDLGVIEPEVTAEKLEASLFADVLGECHSPHTSNSDRTQNLILACEAIDGTVLLPGEEFSFNKVVGERTKEKGYREATVYVSGQSVPQTGGGICQVASTIYSACLYADMEIVESTEHMYFVSYVNPGMDATIYWGLHDYRFKNNTAYPVRIDASVSDGKVHIVLMGTNTKDYTVEMQWVYLSTTNWETVEHVIADGETYKVGEVITTPYTGYRVATYMLKYDLSGNLLSKDQVRISNYSKRDKVVAVADTSEPDPTEPPATDPTTPPETEPPATDPTTPPETDPPATDPTAPPETESPAANSPTAPVSE